MSEDITLPKKPSVPKQELGHYSLLIYGREKIGKTDLAAQFPNAFFLMCEPGGKGQRILQREVTKWSQFKTYVALLEKNKDYAKTIVVDTVDLAYKMCLRYVRKNLGVEHISEVKFGQGYEQVREEFSEQMQKLLSMGRGVIFISHESDKRLPNNKADAEKSRIIPTMPKQAREIIEPMVDIWGYYHYNKKGERSLRIVGSMYVSAGCRLKENFVGIKKIPMGESAKEAYDNFVTAFNSKLPKATGKIKVRR